MSPVRRLALQLVAAVAVLLAGCSLLGPAQVAPGTSAAQVRARLGQPTARYVGTGVAGERWQYSYEPAGRQVYNLDFDASGSVVRVEQVMNEALFGQRIKPGAWTRDDVLREYGRPAWTMRVHNFDGDIWVWRYENGTILRLLYIDIAPDGVVQGYSLGDEPLDPPDYR